MEYASEPDWIPAVTARAATRGWRAIATATRGQRGRQQVRPPPGPDLLPSKAGLQKVYKILKMRIT